MHAPAAFANDDLTQVAVVESPVGQAVVFATKHPSRLGPSQDSAVVIPTAEGVVLAVADGVGGGPEGDKASRFAIEALLRHLRDLGGPTRAAVLDAFEAANASVLGLGTGAATTLAVVEVSVGARGLLARTYHTGDSTIAIVGGGGKLKLVTVSHSPVGYAVEAGILDARAALHHEELNVVTNLVGIPDMRIELGAPLPLGARDTVVVGTDGLFDNVHLDEVVDLVRRGPPRRVAEALGRFARKRMEGAEPGAPSKPDDLTFVLFRPRRGVGGPTSSALPGVGRAGARS